MFARQVSCGALVLGLPARAHLQQCAAGRAEARRRLAAVPTLAVTPELQILLSIDNRYELFQFLRRFSATKQFLADAQHVVETRKVDFPKMLNLTDMYSWNGASEETASITQYARKWYPDEFSAQGEFVPQTTLCRNMSDPMLVLKKLLPMTDSLPMSVVLAQIELLLTKVTMCGSQSIINKVNAFVSREISTELRGPLMCYSWVSYYLSPYDSDRNEASCFLEANGHLMQPHLDRMLQSVAHHLLNGRQLNRYYALVQHFAKPAHHNQMKRLLETLFYHFYNTNHLRGCKTCVRLARDLKVELASDVMFKYIVSSKGRTTALPCERMNFIF